MQTLAQKELEESVPRPKIDPADALTLVPRFLAGFFMGGISVMYVVAQNWGMALFLALASAWLLYWGWHLVMKIRRANGEYIAYRTAQEAAERQRKANS